MRNITFTSDPVINETLLGETSVNVWITFFQTNHKYITDEKKRPVAVQIDIETFEKMEQLLEDYALGQLIEQNDPADNLTISEAKEYYRGLNK